MKANFTNSNGVINIELPKKIKEGDLVSVEPDFYNEKLIGVSIVKRRKKKLNPDMPRGFEGIIDCTKENEKSMRLLKAMIKNGRA